MSENPWADPATPTQTGAPYAGPPATGPTPPAGGDPVPPGHPYQPGYPVQSGYPYQPGYPAQYGYPAPWGPVPYGYPAPWGPAPPQGPRRPGQVITSAVLSFVQAGLVLFASLYLWMLLSIAHIAVRQAPTPLADALVTEGMVVAAVQGISVVVLILAGVGALTRRSRAAWLVLLGANGVQVALALYWALRLQSVLSDVPGPNVTGAFSAFAIFFAAAPLVALGLAVFGPGRHWFDGTPRQ